MISPDIRIEGFDAASFTRLVGLFLPNVVTRHLAAAPDSDAPELDHHEQGDGEDIADDTRGGTVEDAKVGTLVLVVSAKGRLRKAFHTRRGRVRDLVYRGPSSLAELAEEVPCKRVVVLTEGALEDLVERASARFERDDDYLTQLITVARAFREEFDRGRIIVHPRPLSAIPLPTPALARRALDSILPDGHAFVLFVFHEARPYTAVVLRRRYGAIDWMAGPELIAQLTGPLGGDVRRDYRIISAAIEEHVAPVHLGVFGELRAIRKLLRTKEAGAWAKAVGGREVIVYPTPPYVAVAVGADALRAVAKRSSRIFGAFDALSMLGPFAGYARSYVAEIASVTATLGFDPLKLLAGWLDTMDPEPLDGDISRSRRSTPPRAANDVHGEDE